MNCDNCGRSHREFQIWGTSWLCPSCHRLACSEQQATREWDMYGRDPEPWVFNEEADRVPA